MLQTADLNTQTAEEGRATTDDNSEFVHFLASRQHDPDWFKRRAAVKHGSNSQKSSCVANTTYNQP